MTTAEAEIDIHTGLPKLSIELLPDSEEDHNAWNKHYPQTDPFDRLPVISAEKMAEKLPRHKSTHIAREPEFPALNNLQHSSSSPECRQRSKSSSAGSFNRHAKQRSSLFIRLHRTSTVPHRLSIVNENNATPSFTDFGVHTAPVGVGEQPDSQFSFPDHQISPSSSSFCSSKGSSSTPDLLAKGSPEDPAPLCSPSTAAKRLSNAGRRNSFLYETDSDKTLPFSHSSSANQYSHMEEIFVTPFAQILATMHKVRENFMYLMNLPEDSRRHVHNAPLTPNPPTRRQPPFASFDRKPSLDTVRQQAMATLEQIDWCLQQLEGVDSAKAMGGPLAQDKFHRLLSRELSNMSEHSRSGNKLAEWVHDITKSTNERNQQVDRALNHDIVADSPTNDMQLSASLSHDIWRKRAMVKSRSGTQIHIKLAEDSEKVPSFGVENKKLKIIQMRKFMEDEVGLWSPDVFRLEEISASNSLVCSAYNILKTRELSRYFKVSPPTFINFMQAIQNRYHSSNPYHNHIHAADVLLTTDFLLKAKPLENVFSKLEVFAALVAAAVHDVDHPGRSNQFLIETNNHLAVLYNDNSVLENHHLAVAFQILAEPGCNFLEQLDKEQTKAFRRMVIDMVLATDMSVHFKHLAELKTLLETKTLTNDGILELDTYKERSELLQCLIHCADLSNPAKEEELAVNWSNRIMQEGFQQGDEERSRGIPVNPLGDREQVSIAKCQVTFIDLIVYPLFETWSDLVYPEAQHILDNLNSTRQYWSTRIPNSPPPTSPSPTSSPTPTTTPTTPQQDTLNTNRTTAEGNDDVITFGSGSDSGCGSGSGSLPLVKEEAVLAMDEPLHSDSSNTSSIFENNKAPPANPPTPAKDRRNSYKSTRDMAVELEER